MADFKIALKYALENEGTWSDHPKDKGGPTKWGITLKLAAKYGYDTVDKLSHMDQKDRDFIYKAEFWRFGGLDSQAVATKTFDIAVNAGLRVGVIALQECIKRHQMINVDGCYGPFTEKMANACDPDKLVTLLCAYQRARYLIIANHDTSQKVFINGWLTRAERKP